MILLLCTGRHRWVSYARKDFDATQVPPEWLVVAHASPAIPVKWSLLSLHRHRWLHAMTDIPPTVEPPTQRKFLDEHVENLSGTDREYVPYSTTQPKIEAWRPPE